MDKIAVIVFCMAMFSMVIPVSAQKGQTDQDIDKYRKGELVVKAKPGDKIVIEQLSHDFWFGCCLSNGMFTGMTPAKESEQYREKFLENFNAAVTENALKWATMEPVKGKPDYSVIDAMLIWTEENHIPLRGHNLFWGISQFIQPWVKELNDTELEQTIRRRAETITAKYKGRFAEYDLNNEMVHGNYYETRLGPDITKNMAQWALKGDPDARLFLNDYDILTGVKLNDYMSQIRHFLSQGIPLAGIGVQGHLHGDTFDREQLKKALDSLAVFRLPVRVTEFNMPGQRSAYYKDKNLVMTPAEEEINAGELTGYFRICFAHPAVEGILLWGFREGSNWIRQSSLYKNDWTLTATGKAYRDLVFRQWWVNESGTAGNDGIYPARVFFGKYRITAGPVSRIVNFPKSQGRTVIDFREP